jgi:hypothetical protein
MIGDGEGNRNEPGDGVAAADIAPTAAHGPPPDLSRLRRLAGLAEARMRLGRAIDHGTTVLAGSLLGAAIVLAAAKTTALADPTARRILIALAAAPVIAALIGWMRRLPPLAGAVALDKEAGLHDRIATALAFGGKTEPSPFERAAIDDALAHADRAKPSRAVAIPVPRDLLLAVAIGGVVAVVASLEVRRHVEEAQAPTIDALEVDPDDLEALEDFANQLKDQPQSDDDMKAAVADFNKLVEDLKNRRIDRNEAFRRMADLDTKLQKSGELDRKALEEALKKVGSELKKNELTKEAGQALEKGDKKEAEKKLRELAKKLKANETKLTEEQKKALAEALKKAANRDREKALAEMKAAREKLEKDLEKARAEKDKNGGKETAEREKDRKNKERELERLDREEKQMASADRQLSKLDRDLETAANDILKDLGLSAADLESGAEDLNRMAQDDLTAEEKEELRQRLKELHDLLVQQGKLTPEQIEKLKEFMKKAKGGKNAKAGKKKKPGKLGKFDPNADPNGGGDDKGGDDKGDDGDDGDDEGDGQGKSWTLGPDGNPIPIPGAGPGAPGGNGEGKPGPGAGTGHDPSMLGKKTSNKVGTTDIQVAGQDSGKGPKRSETILGAADKGFVGKNYKQVYGEYKSVAEEALKQDEIPAGYRFYVRRYFDLIRPRD